MTDTTVWLFHGEEELDLDDEFTVTRKGKVDSFVEEVLSGDIAIPDSLDAVLVSPFPDQQITGESAIEGAFALTDIPVLRIGPKHTARTLTYNGQDRFTAPAFEGLFTRNELDNGAVDSFIEEYQQVFNTDVQGRDSIISLLSPPEEVPTEDVKCVTPLTTEVENHPKRLSAWIIYRFLTTPGAVVGRKRAAVKAGMTVEAFLDRREDFEAARYDGAFSEYVGERWWLPTVERIVFETEYDLDEEERPDCVVCGESGVDRCAHHEHSFGEVSSETIEPVHYRCSNITTSRPGVYAGVRETANGQTKTVTDRFFGD